jgi:all-trans-retinol dehydrogenase (NAD+)
MTTPTKVLRQVVTLPISTSRYLAQTPLLTGSLLYLLTRAPADVRERFLRPLRPYLLSKNADARLATTVKILKVLLALGIQRTISQLLTQLALNYWYVRRPGAPWRFDESKSETVVVTGGCSGFGYEMVKGFAGKATVVVLDISDMPPDLAKRE